MLVLLNYDSLMISQDATKLDTCRSASKLFSKHVIQIFNRRERLLVTPVLSAGLSNLRTSWFVFLIVSVPTVIDILQRQCQLMFPEAFPELPHVNIEQTNALYKGWNVELKRLFFANGQRK